MSFCRLYVSASCLLGSVICTNKLVILSPIMMTKLTCIGHQSIVLQCTYDACRNCNPTYRNSDKEETATDKTAKEALIMIAISSNCHFPYKRGWRLPACMPLMAHLAELDQQLPSVRQALLACETTGALRNHDEAGSSLFWMPISMRQTP